MITGRISKYFSIFISCVSFYTLKFTYFIFLKSLSVLLKVCHTNYKYKAKKYFFLFQSKNV